MLIYECQSGTQRILQILYPVVNTHDYINVWRSTFTMILHEAMLEWLKYVGWKTCSRRETIASYCKIILKCALCWSLRFFFVGVVAARCRLFQVVADRFLLVVGRFSSFQVVSCSLYVVWGRVSSFCFLLVVGRFKSFQIVSRFCKYDTQFYIRFFCCCKSFITGNKTC